MTIFERTKETAKERGLTLRQVEEKAGLGQNSIYRWKTYTPRFSNLQKVADVLNVSVDYLLGNTDEMRPSANTTNESNSADLKNIMEEFKILEFDGKEIDPDDLPIIERIIKGLIDERNS